ncbi:RNB-domain-containing protein [Paxillus ammoniavirescens]|nr:RNB-domain-containing protein [Paxillus ammoniavirescens]
MHRRGAQVLGDVRPSNLLKRASDLSQEVKPSSKANLKQGVSEPRSPSRPSRNHFFKEVQELRQVTEKLVKASSRSAVLPASGWTHKNTRRGEEKRLQDAVRTAVNARRPPTNLQAAWQDAAANPTLRLDEAEELQADDIPAPGTFVEIRRGMTVTSGIVVGNAFIDNRNYLLSLSLSGDTLTHNIADIFFEIPQMVSRDLAERAGISASPTNRTEISARVEILKQLREVERQIAQAYCAIGSRNIALYPLVRSKNPDEWSTVTVPQAAKFISNTRESGYPTLLASHRYLMKHIIEFVPHLTSHRVVQTWAVRPQSHVDKLTAVRDMIHRSDPAIDIFVAKACSIMIANQKRRLDSWNEPPAQEPAMDVHYTAEDRLIVDVLHHALRQHRDIRIDPYSLVVTTILKKMEVAEVIDSGVLHQVLVDLGHLAPWDDLVSRKRELGLSQIPDQESPKVIAENHIVQKNLTRMTTATAHGNTPLGPEDFYFRDPVEHLRHDFGNLPVYVVDDVGAEELDDGLSVEPIPSEPGAAWIHVHVADPTAVIPPAHIFAQRARQMGSTAYFAHRTWPMLPVSLTQSQLSLGAKSQSGQPEHVLTFSFKIDSAGNMADYTVRAGLIRNVITVDYDSVDHLLGSIKKHETFRPFDLERRSSLCVTDLATEHVDNLRLITEVTSRHKQRNLNSSNYFYSSLPKARITITPKPLVGTPIHSPTPFHFLGFPSLTYEVVGQQMQDSGSRMVISECMKAACRVASRWSFDNGLPMLRRSSKSPVCLGDPQALEKLLAMRDPAGYVDFYAVQKSKLYIPPVEHRLEPAMHWSMGIPDGEGYIRVTSPLRRYNDLVAHWQIKHALLHPRTTTPLFSPGWLTEYAPEIKKKEKESKRAEQSHFSFWSHLYIKRFMGDPRAGKNRHDLLQSLTAIVSGVRPNDGMVSSPVPCYIPSLGLLGSLSAPSIAAYAVGESVKVRITSVETGLQPRLHLALRK